MPRSLGPLGLITAEGRGPQGGLVKLSSVSVPAQPWAQLWPQAQAEVGRACGAVTEQPQGQLSLARAGLRPCWGLCRGMGPSALCWHHLAPAALLEPG